MKTFPAVILKKGKEAAVLRFHPWIFSGAIFRIFGHPEEGDTVEVFSAEKEYLATGHYQRGSIAIKVFSYTKTPADRAFWKTKIEQAFGLRKILNLTENSENNAFRMVNSEGDGLPGLIIDWYNGVAVIQSQSPGMLKLNELFSDILREIFG
ncbi:MAG: class I SAM-dependent rRNA methyltransferase, partial [Bacteroidota bacterium]|nr:class I SAM-dependent rRNA methyltransferase [Bacteroidota bacterium]